MRMGLERAFMDGMCLGNDMSIQSIAVLGAGQMGNGIAQSQLVQAMMLL